MDSASCKVECRAGTVNLLGSNPINSSFRRAADEFIPNQPERVSVRFRVKPWANAQRLMMASKLSSAARLNASPHDNCGAEIVGSKLMLVNAKSKNRIATFPFQYRISRRCCLQSTSLGLLGLSLSDVLRHRAVADSSVEQKARSAIFIWLQGGPSHHETFDPKPDAPAGIRGEFSAIPTQVAGIRFAESIPLLAKQMKRMSVIRSVTHRQASHEQGSAYMVSGYNFRPGHNFPSVGGVVSFERQGSSRKTGLPPYVGIPNERIRGGGHLGPAYNPLSIPGDPNAADFRVQDLVIPEGITSDRFLQRRELSRLVNLDFRKSRVSDVQESIDKYTQQAYDMIMSPNAQAALDLGREETKTRDRYGRSTFGQRLLLSRRLVEAGVPFVTVTDPEWDDHRSIFSKFRSRMPVVDQALSTLLADLDLRGLLDSTLIIVAGEFGRTPKMNATGGRDHWSQTFSVMLAGGGVRGGQVIGASDKEGAFPKDRPVKPEDLMYSVYSQLGIEPEKFLPATNGREVQILADGEFIDELTV